MSPASNKALIAWSSGKDSAFALLEARRSGDYEIVGALTTVTDPYDRVSIHGVRTAVLNAQLAAAGLPPLIVTIPAVCTNAIYETAMAAAMAQARQAGITHVIFGDLFLLDVRAYREQKLAGTGITPVFPLWGRPTPALALEMIAAGLEAALVCVDLKRLPKALAGRAFDTRLLGELPPDVDPCGENGEFHTCVVAGPMFSQPLSVQRGDVVERDGFAYADLILTPT